MGLGDFEGLRGLDNVFVEFLRVGGDKGLKVKAIGLDRFALRAALRPSAER
jgi:hypothetical protein